VNPRHHQGMSYTTAGVIALVVTLVACYFGFTKANPFASNFELKAAFKTTNNIRPNSPVRIAGVTIGKVTRVESDGRNGAIVTLQIKDKGQPIHADAHAAIRPRIFLEGNFFVDVQPGTPSAPVLDNGDVIPVNQTSTPVQLDQILTALQSDTRTDLQVVLKEYASALKGRGARGYRRSLQYWKPAYRDSAIVADASLGEAEHDLSEYIAGATKVAAALDRSPTQLKALITDFNTTAAAFARSDTNLSAAIRELPRTLRAAQPALGKLNASFPPLRALVHDLRPGVRNSLPAILASTPLVEQLRGLVSQPELRGLVSDLRPTVPRLARLTTRTVPLYERVRSAASCQNEVILPWTKKTVPDSNFPASGPVYEEAVKPLPGLAGESRSGDANGQWFRVLAAGGNNVVTLKPGVFAAVPSPIKGSNPPRPDARPPLNRSVPCETQQAPNLATEPGAAPPQRTIDVTSAAYQARYALAKSKAVTWLRKQLKLEGLEKQFSVIDKDVTPSLVDKMARLRGGRP
jgi:phospholipid/cholesterol/gamma-HCH transport system substrate-binding protein